MVVAQDVANFLGQGDDPTTVALAREVLSVVTALAGGYTRGQGFFGSTPGVADLDAVIITASARLVAHPEQIEQRIGDTYTRGGFTGWTLAELAVLNRYRKRAA